MDMKQEREKFMHWVSKAMPFDTNVGWVECRIQRTAAWQGWMACLARGNTKMTLQQQITALAVSQGRWTIEAAQAAAKIAADEYGDDVVSTEDLYSICAEVLRVDGEA